ncbi:hypothetical protein ACEPAF_566 [Sanghuangporus sanghuang]
MTDDIEPVSTFCVQDPFTVNDYADVILRSSDGFSFYAIKCLLSMTSPIFRDLFSHPKATIRAGQVGEWNLPVVDITESGIVTDALLRYLYPVDDPDLTVELAFDVLLATQKYEIQHALRLAKKAIRALCSVDESAALRTFALASRHRLENEIRFAAQESLKYCLLKSPQIHQLAIDPSSGRAILILSQYHNEVANRVADVFLRSPDALKGFILCEGCNNTGSPYSPRCKVLSTWWTNLCHDMTQLKRASICGPLSENGISVADISKRVNSAACYSCNCRFLQEGPDKFVKNLKGAMEETASEVTFHIPWEEAQ